MQGFNLAKYQFSLGVEQEHIQYEDLAAEAPLYGGYDPLDLHFGSLRLICVYLNAVFLCHILFQEIVSRRFFFKVADHCLQLLLSCHYDV